LLAPATSPIPFSPSLTLSATNSNVIIAFIQEQFDQEFLPQIMWLR
jgi:hypothetical protein